MGIVRSYGIQIIIILLLAIGIAAGVYLVQRQQIFKPKAADFSKFQIGFNVRGLAHYGYHDLYKYAEASYVDDILAETKRLGGTILRIYLANKYISDDKTATRLDDLLTKAENFDPNISFIVSFINYYEDTGNYPQSAAGYYDKSTHPDYPVPLLNANFYRSGYKTSYLPFVKTVIDKNKLHNNIYAWEIGNELQAPNPQLMIDFAKDVSSKIREYDPNREHKISTGFLRASHAVNQPVKNNADLATQLYSSLTDVDMISVVTYSGDNEGIADITWAAQNNKIPIVAEGGFSNQLSENTPTGRDRSKAFAESIDTYTGLGAKAYIIWGFLPKSFNQNKEDGDGKLGFDNLWHTDYDQINEVIQSKLNIPISYNDAPSVKFVKLDISNNKDFSGDTITIDNPTEEQYVAVDYTPVYVKEYYGTSADASLQTRAYDIPMARGKSSSVGEVLIKVK